MQKATAHLERAFAISEAELGFGRALHDTRLWLKGKVEKYIPNQTTYAPTPG